MDLKNRLESLTSKSTSNINFENKFLLLIRKSISLIISKINFDHDLLS